MENLVVPGISTDASDTLHGRDLVETTSWLYTPEALEVQSIFGSAKRWNGSCVLCPPFCSLYGVILPTQDLGAKGKEVGVGFSICCETWFFQRLSGASHPAPVGNGNCEPPGILLK